MAARQRRDMPALKRDYLVMIRVGYSDSVRMDGERGGEAVEGGRGGGYS